MVLARGGRGARSEGQEGPLQGSVELHTLSHNQPPLGLTLDQGF